MTFSLAASRLAGRQSGPDRARTGVLIVLVAQLMLVLDATVVNVALPRIDADLVRRPAVVPESDQLEEATLAEAA